MPLVRTVEATPDRGAVQVKPYPGFGEATFMGESGGTLPDSSIIRLHRQQGFYVDRLRAYRVRIDGNPAGKIAEGETKDFLVPPGEHRVRLAIDRFWTSREVALQLREGELAEFTCHPPWAITAMALLFSSMVRSLLTSDGSLS